jgi:hypothetical protein
MRLSTGILALTTAFLVLTSGASCLDASFGAFGSLGGSGTGATFEGDDGVQGITTASFSPSGVRMAGYISASGPLYEHHYVGTSTGEYAEVHASAASTGHYAYSWDFQPGSHSIAAWENVLISDGSGVVLSSAASNSDYDYATVSTSIDRGSVDYFSMGTADTSKALASQVVNYAYGNSISFGWSASNREGDCVSGDVFLDGGSILSPAYAWSGADKKATRAELDLNNALVSGYDLSIGAKNWLFKTKTEKHSGASRSLGLDILDAATAYKLQAKASVKKAV